jgi:hypothetical protein
MGHLACMEKPRNIEFILLCYNETFLFIELLVGTVG